MCLRRCLCRLWCLDVEYMVISLISMNVVHELGYHKKLACLDSFLVLMYMGECFQDYS